MASEAGQAFASPRADMFKAETGTVSRMFASYVMLESSFLKKATAAPANLVGFTRSEWRTILKGHADDWHFNTKTWDKKRTESYVKAFGLQQLYATARLGIEQLVASVTPPVAASPLSAPTLGIAARPSSSSSASPPTPLRDLLRPVGQMRYMGHPLPVYDMPDDEAAAKNYEWLSDSCKRFLAWRIQALCFCSELLRLDIAISQLSGASAAAKMSRPDRLDLIYAVWGGGSPMTDTTRFTDPDWRKRLPAIKALHALVVGWERADGGFPTSVPEDSQLTFKAAEKAIFMLYAQTYVDVWRRYPPFPLERPSDPWF